MSSSQKIGVYATVFIAGWLLFHDLKSTGSRSFALIGISVVCVMLGRELLNRDIAAAREETGEVEASRLPGGRHISATAKTQ